MSFLKSLWLILFLLLVIPTFGVLYLTLPTAGVKKNEVFVVPLNSYQSEMVLKLKEEKYIRSETLFNLLTLYNYQGRLIAPGSYLISHNMNLFTLLTTLYSDPYQKWIILVPGLRVEQIGERLQKKFGWGTKDLQEFLKASREGYMFPDTYLLESNISGQKAAEKLVNNFNEKFDQQIQNDLLKENVRNDTAIKVASLIERESGGPSDKALISGIIWNRLSIGMKLQIDATIQYIKGQPNDWWPEVLGEDLSLDSPYNSYIHQGLPPTPIANPSLSSILAAVHPATTECLFYLHDRGKLIHCSKTYEEHLTNIRKFLD